jgi:hypothetical protein
MSFLLALIALLFVLIVVLKRGTEIKIEKCKIGAASSYTITLRKKM